MIKHDYKRRDTRWILHRETKPKPAIIMPVLINVILLGLLSLAII